MTESQLENALHVVTKMGDRQLLLRELWKLKRQNAEANPPATKSTQKNSGMGDSSNAKSQFRTANNTSLSAA